MLLALVGAACTQEPDVVARVEWLDSGGPPAPEAGNPAPTPAPSPDMCRGEILAIYGLLARIGSDCQVPDNPLAQASVLSWLNEIVAAQPPQIRPAEETGISYCDRYEQTTGRPLVFYVDEGHWFLCPMYCESAHAWVAKNEDLVLACLDGSVPP